MPMPSAMVGTPYGTPGTSQVNQARVPRQQATATGLASLVLVVPGNLPGCIKLDKMWIFRQFGVKCSLI